MVDGATTSAGWNRYMYVHGNPVMYKDPTGHDTYYDKFGKQVNDTGKGNDVYMFKLNQSSAPTKMESEEAVKKAAESTLQKAKTSEANKAGNKVISPVSGTNDGFIIQSFHNGHEAIDIGVKQGTPVVSAKSSRVINVVTEQETIDANKDKDGSLLAQCKEKKNCGGNLVVTEEPDGTRRVYAHLSTTSVKINDELKQGGVLGKSGNTGYTFGPHLHYSVEKNGKRIDAEQEYQNDNGKRLIDAIK